MKGKKPALPSTSLLTENKDNENFNYSQIEIIMNVFMITPLTMLMAAKKANIERANICRYVSMLKKQNRIAIINKKPCQITGHIAGYYTTNHLLFPCLPQLKLF